MEVLDLFSAAAFAKARAAIARAESAQTLQDRVTRTLGAQMGW